MLLAQAIVALPCACGKQLNVSLNSLYITRKGLMLVKQPLFTINLN